MNTLSETLIIGGLRNFSLLANLGTFYQELSRLEQEVTQKLNRLEQDTQLPVLIKQEAIRDTLSSLEYIKAQKPMVENIRLRHSDLAVRQIGSSTRFFSINNQ